MRKTHITLFIGVLLILLTTSVNAQLGIYSFTGPGNCPTTNVGVDNQPANAIFSNYTNVNADCDQINNAFQYKNWDHDPGIDLTQYNTFTITPNLGFTLTLTSLSFQQKADQGGPTTWALRSSIDNFAANIATGPVTTSFQTAMIALSPASFTNIGAVTFRIYLINANGGGTKWINDDVTLNGIVSPIAVVVIAPMDPANPTSNSPQCVTTGVTMNFTGTAPVGETWYWQTTATGISTANSSPAYTVNSSGTYYVRSQDNTTMAWSNAAGSVTVSVTPAVGTPVFSLGANSSRCEGPATISYVATAASSTGIMYDLDAASIAGGNSINPSTGDVNYVTGWTGTSVITATATGCDGNSTAIHTVTVTAGADMPVFAAGATSTICQGAATITYAASNTSNTIITYSLDAASIAGGNTINTSGGDVTYTAGWSGTTTITATATGCNGNFIATHIVTITPAAGTLVFTLGNTSTRCQGGGVVTYTATSTNSTGITYSLDATSAGAGNNINASTGQVSYVAGWSGISIITATATGCNGSASATHTATTTATIGTPVFVLGASSTRCQGASTVTYTATATAATSITYSLDALSLLSANSINASTGVVTYSGLWIGTSIITATATGCSGSATATHSVTIGGNISNPVFTLGNTSTRCQGAGTVSYTATATNASGITYTLDAASTAGNNTIDPITGAVTYDAAWAGTTTITATATGCNGPKTKTHIVTIGATLGTPVFILGATSTRCQTGGSITYTATASNNTGLSYSLDAASISGGNNINSSGKITYNAGWSGTSVITVTANGCGGPLTAIHTITTNPTISAPVFALGASSSRCQGVETIIYTATASNSTGVTYSLNGGSLAAGNTINAATGEVTFVAGWTGVSVINASANGCGGPLNASHVVTTNLPVGAASFSLGATSTRCQGAGTVTYTASASNNTGMTYSLDAASIAAGNSINSANGAVTYAATWTGTSTITTDAAGCGGPTSATHTVTINPSVITPVFISGASSTRCQGAGTVTYNATATNSTGISYSLNAACVSGGNTISTSTGAVNYVAGWTGATIITCTATGCNGPVTATHTVTITPTVSTPTFILGTTSTRCQGAGTVTYTANATNNTGITYSLDAASITNGNTIDASTGAVTFTAGWAGTSTITASATGCNGPSSGIHTVTITATVGTPVFSTGATSTRCQGTAMVTYTATATTSTGITYSLDAASITGGNSINAASGDLNYGAGWSGTSVITASATGCNGPITATHTVTVTPTVGTPAFSLGNTSTRCQAAGTVTYTATSTNNTGITYSLDAASITGGNSINAGNASVTYAAGWSGTSTITATATGCNGPKTKTHTVTVTPVVGTPSFALGLESVRTQASGTVTYTATAVNSTSMVYSLDAASISGGNSINAATGTVTWSAGWNGTSMITVTANGCSSVTTAPHIVTTNANVVQAPLYLSVPGQALDRIDPVATGINTTTQTAVLSSVGTTNISFTQSQALCSDLTIKAQTISISVYVSIASGAMPASPAITALIKYGSTNIISFSNPIYNSGSGLLTWTGVLPADAIVPSGQAITLQITTAQAGVTFKIDYHSMSKPSRISLLPVSTFVNIISFNVYNAAYPNGTVISSSNTNTNVYARAVVTNPFGYKDITGLDIGIIYPAYSGVTTCVDSSTCSRTYQFGWTTPNTTGNYNLLATARQGYESSITISSTIPFDVCTFCPPVTASDSAIGNGGAPVILDVLLNDYDPNNNINKSTLSISVQPNNGTGYISNGKLVYLPNGSYAGKDTITYRICDSTSLCATGKAYFTINPLLVDPCSEATKTHVYYLPFSENEARISLDSSTNSAFPSNTIRTVVSMKMPYPGMTIVWDQWEDGYEVNALNPMQSTTQVWGDGNPYNGIAPGYSSDIIPAGGSIVLDNLVPTNPRVISNILYDGRDKITASGQITVTQVSGEPSIMAVQCMKTNVSATIDYGTLFTIPAGMDFPSQDFKYTSLFIRAAQNNTTISIDKDNNGTLETTATINEGQVYHVNGGVLSGATVTSTAPIGVELHFGGNDSYSSRDVPIFPASWYYHTYYSPVPTTGSSTAIKDTSVVMLYNNLNRSLTINWSSGIPSSGSITLPAKKVVRFPLAKSQTAAYKFVNPTGESFTAIEIVDSYTPGGGGNTGLEYDWSFNLIAQNRLTDFATVAWAPGSIDGTRNDNPVWVTSTNNTTIYVKYNGNISGTTGSISPCGMRYDASFPLSALNFIRLLDASDNDQSGLAVFTCDGTKLAAVYGEDPSTAVQANPSWDVGSTIQPFCKQKLIFANDDYARTLINQPVTIPILLNDFGFLAVIDPTSVTTTALLQPKHGFVTINANGTVLYTPNPGYVGKDTFEYNVCSTPTPVVCDIATVYVDISVCPAPFNENVIGGQVFNDKNKDGLNNDGGTGIAGAKVWLYVDGNCNTVIDANELKDSVTVDASGMYQFITYPERFVEDNFNGPGSTNTCATGTDGNSAWLSNWVDAGDPSTGYCQVSANPDAEIKMDNAFGYALRLKDNNVSATRTVNLTGASYAFMSFSYRRKSATLTAGHDVIVQASSNGSTFGTVFTISGDGTTDPNYVTIYNQDITAYASGTTYIRFLTNNNVGDADTVYIGDVKVQFLRYPQCYITKLDTTTIPLYHHTTTVTSHKLTATSTTTCLSPNDFGVTKNTVSISGTLFNDANGLVDNLVNGTVTGTVSGSSVYAYLVDTSGKVLYKTTINSSNGTYSFPTVDILSSFKVVASTSSVGTGAIPPASVGLVSNWTTTGDCYGVNNMGGSGNKAGAATSSITVMTGATNVTGVNFGVERLPDSDDKSVSYTTNTPGLQYAIPALTGSDPEDGLLGTGRAYKITSLPTNATLYYSGAVVTLNQVITSFNSALFKIDPNDFVLSSTFTYASRDAAQLFDPTPATVQVNWVTLLPITLLDFNGKLNGTKVDLFWQTSSETNSDHFDVERSTDGQDFKAFTLVKAKGNTSTETSYAAVDPLPVKGLNYYRLKMIDKDAAFVYSKIVIIKVNSEASLTTRVMPNPFTGKLDIYLTLTHSCMVAFNFVDINGKIVYSKKVKGLKGFNWFTVNDLEKLPSAPYILNLVTDENTFTEKLIKQ
ncbi:MAG: Ig-like domain-containing protein [Ferruginibacter sp.]